MTFLYSSPAFEEAFTYGGKDLGAVWSKNATSFRLWAPTATGVVLHLYEAGEGGSAKVIPMNKAENGTWVCRVEGDLEGLYYTFCATVDGISREAADPYATACGRNGLRSMVIDHSATEPEGWKNYAPSAHCDSRDCVLYELHIRDLSMDAASGIAHKGKFLGLTEAGTHSPAGHSTGLDYLTALGITHLHLLPAYDFGSVDEGGDPSQYNWGYDPVNYNVPEGSYATDPHDGHVRVKEMKRMIHALHQRGIRVVLDVVYNHVFDRDSFCFNRLVPGYFSRGDSNGSFCGNDTASERSMVRKFIVDSVCHWADLYQIDGFRFDLVGLLDVDTVNAIVSAVHATHPHVLFYGEGWELPTVPTKKVALATQKNSHLTPRFSYFSDTVRDLLRGSVWNDTELGFVSGRKGCKPLLDACMAGTPHWCQDPTQSVNYASCHDNMTLFDRIVVSTPTATRQEQVRMNHLAAAIYMCCQGVPFIHAGEELLRSKNFDHNSYKSPDSVNSIQWLTLSQAHVQETLAYYKGLIAIRKAYLPLRRGQVTAIPGLPEHVAAYRVSCQTQEMLLLFNAANAPFSLPLPQGSWRILVQGQFADARGLGNAEKAVTADPISAVILCK